MTGALHQQSSLFSRLRVAVRLKPLAPGEPRAGAPQVGELPSLTLEAEIQRRVRTPERDRWISVGNTHRALRPATFSPGVPPAWSLLIPRSAGFRVGDRLVIGERIFQPVVISQVRDGGLRELVALEEWPR